MRIITIFWSGKVDICPLSNLRLGGFTKELCTVFRLKVWSCTTRCPIRIDTTIHVHRIHAVPTHNVVWPTEDLFAVACPAIGEIRWPTVNAANVKVNTSHIYEHNFLVFHWNTYAKTVFFSSWRPNIPIRFYAKSHNHSHIYRYIRQF
jgi:hypothetical protein